MVHDGEPRKGFQQGDLNSWKKVTSRAPTYQESAICLYTAGCSFEPALLVCARRTPRAKTVSLRDDNMQEKWLLPPDWR